MSDSRVGEQLTLGLYKGVPWDGRSPRVLTRGRLGLIFKTRVVPPRGFPEMDPRQLSLWPEEPTLKEGPPRYVGAPLLMPLPPNKSRMALVGGEPRGRKDHG